MNQTIAERKKLARYSSNQDMKYNPARHVNEPYLERLIIVSLIILMSLSCNDAQAYQHGNKAAKHHAIVRAVREQRRNAPIKRLDKKTAAKLDKVFYEHQQLKKGK